MENLLPNDILICDEDDIPLMQEVFKENEMLEHFKKLVKNYKDSNGYIVIPAGTKVELIREPKQFGEPTIYEIIENKIQFLVWSIE